MADLAYDKKLSASPRQLRDKLLGCHLRCAKCQGRRQFKLDEPAYGCADHWLCAGCFKDAVLYYGDVAEGVEPPAVGKKPLSLLSLLSLN